MVLVVPLHQLFFAAAAVSDWRCRIRLWAAGIKKIIFLFLKARHLNATINPQQTRLTYNTFPKPTRIFNSQLHKLRQHSYSHLGGAAGSVLQLARCLRFFSEGRASCSGGGGGPLCGSSRLTASWPRCGMPRSPWE